MAFSNIATLAASSWLSDGPLNCSCWGRKPAFSLGSHAICLHPCSLAGCGGKNPALGLKRIAPGLSGVKLDVLANRRRICTHALGRANAPTVQCEVGAAFPIT